MHNLLALAQNGDRDAQEKIFQELLVRFRIFAKRRISNNQDAEDIAQEACITVLSKYRDEEFEVSFEAWAYGVLRMKIGNYLSSAKVRRSLLAAGTYPSGEVSIFPDNSDPDLKARMEECFRRIVKIHPQYARILNLTYQGYKVSEVCGRLEINPNYVYVLLHRGRALLKMCLESGRV